MCELKFAADALIWIVVGSLIAVIIAFTIVFIFVYRYYR